MRKSELEKLKSMLQQEKEHLDKELDHFESLLLSKTMKEAGGDLSSCTTHKADQASDIDENQKLFIIMERVQNRLKEVDEALDKVENGEFGVCRSCGEKIQIKRLLAKPQAEYCIECRQKFDDSNNHH